jgi:hypothetical protein
MSKISIISHPCQILFSMSFSQWVRCTDIVLAARQNIANIRAKSVLTVSTHVSYSQNLANHPYEKGFIC